MAEHYEEFDVDFSTADVSDVVVSFADRILTVSFADVAKKKATVVFRGVAGCKWDENLFERIEASPDRVYRVRDSEWLKQLHGGGRHSHFALGFCGSPGFTFLEVIAETMEHKNA